jgi:hypothetical protein
VLFNLAAIALAEHKAEHATLILGAAEALNRGAKLAPDPEELELFEQALSAARMALDTATFAFAWQRGEYLSIDQLVAMALDEAL